MPSCKEVILTQMSSSDFVLNKMIADLSDAEFFKPPVAGANHAAWVVGHIAVSEDSMVADLTGRSKRYPKEHELFRGGSTCLADASKYPPRKAIEELLRNCRAHTIEALKAFDEKKWNDPSPEGWPRDVFPTLGSIWALMGAHPFWHIGQLSVCRQAMGKKRVLG